MKYLLATFFLCLSTLAHAQLSNESELALAAANGNTKTETLSVKQLNDYKWDLTNVINFKARYLNATANGDETARYLMSGLRYEKEVSNHLGIFAGETYEADRFAGIDRRWMSDLGGRYRFIDTDLTKFFTDLGYRYMDERRLDNTSAFSNYGRVYSEWEHKWNLNFSTRYWIEYLPNITVNNDWQLNTEFSLSAVLSSVFSLKAGILIRYDHLPAPGILYKTDTLFTSALVAKF